jgi:hypothetical protein
MADSLPMSLRVVVLVRPSAGFFVEDEGPLTSTATA